VIQEKKQVISDLKEHHLNEHQLLQKDISEVKTSIHQGFIVVQENIGTLTKAHNQLNLSFQTHNTTTQEKNKLEQELQTLKAEHNNDWMKYGAVGGLGFGAGILVDRFV